MRFSLRFLLGLMIFASIGAWVVMDRQKLRTEIKSLNDANKELRDSNRALQLESVVRRLASQDAKVQELKKDLERFKSAPHENTNDGSIRSLDKYRRSQD